jgi:hypothetical protein
MHLESISNVFYSYRKMFVIEIQSAASLGMQCESTGLLSYVSRGFETKEFGMPVSRP